MSQRNDRPPPSNDGHGATSLDPGPERHNQSVARVSTSDLERALNDNLASGRRVQFPEEGLDSDCFFAVVDITPDNSVSYWAECLVKRMLPEFYSTVKPQEEGIFRIILDGSEEFGYRGDPPASRDQCWTPKAYENLPRYDDCPLYSRSMIAYPTIPSNQFALRSLWSIQAPKNTYTFHAFAIHRSSCDHQPLLKPRMPEIPYFNQRNMLIANVTKEQEKQKWVVFSFDCETTQNKDKDPKTSPCASPNWVLMKAIRDSLCCSDSWMPRCNGIETETAKSVIMIVFLACLQHTVQVMSSFYECYFGYLLGKRTSQENIPNEVFRQYEHLKIMGTSVHRLIDAMNYVTGSIEASFQRHVEYPRTILPAALWDVQELCRISASEASRMLESTKEQAQASLDELNRSQATSVARLTILASFFLPLSLAAGVLSMQTRLSKLGMLLFDFGGVMSFLSAITAVLIFIIKYLTKARKDGTWVGRLHWTTPLFTLLLVLVSASWLVGMLKDVRTGLIVLGIELGGLVVLNLAISLLFTQIYYTVRKWRKEIYTVLQPKAPTQQP